MFFFVIDGMGKFKIDMGVLFFDYMFMFFVKYGLFDFDVKCIGDVVVDYYYIVEDVGIVFGEVFK